MKSIIATALLAACVCMPSAAEASAWTQKKGKGQVMVTGVYSHSGKGYDANGDKTDIPDYDKKEVYISVELGIDDDTTVTFTPSLRAVDVQGGDDTRGLGYTEVGLRRVVVKGDTWVLSAQAAARIPGTRRRDNLAQVGSTDAEYDIRGLFGKSFKIAGMDAFVDLQGGYRLRDGAPPNEYHADVTIGFRPAARVQIIGQVYSTFSDGAGRGVFGAYRYHNAYLNAVYDIDPSWSLQFGGLATLGGENALRERGLTAGIWRRF